MKKHGGINARELRAQGINPDEVLDFSVSINPHKLPESIRSVIAQSALERYPDNDSHDLVEAIAQQYALSKENIMVVNGTSQAIFLIAAAFLSNTKASSLVATPAYREYSDAAQVYGAQCHEIRALAEEQFTPNAPSIIHALKTHRPQVFWIGSPNNPTGTLLSHNDAVMIRDACVELGTLMVIDEAYRCFAPPEAQRRPLISGALYLRSMTKDFSIPGLRLGWLHGDEQVIQHLRSFQPDWSVSAPAQDAGVACLAQLSEFEATWEKTRGFTQELAQNLKRLGYSPLPTAGNFQLLPIGQDDDVKRLISHLKKSLIQVRDCASFGLEGFIRVGTRSQKDNQILLHALESFSK